MVQFPELRHELNRGDYSIYQLFSDLHREVWEAHNSWDDGKLSKIYGFAEWCLFQSSQELSNPAGVSFYAHVIASRRQRQNWAKVIPWLSPRVVREVSGLWEYMLEPSEWNELQKMFAEYERNPQSTSPG
ncbi:MAG: hypothetical protein WKH64_12090 [Chloroflexia bacterium]